ncbi:unnamed protein product [Musa acuminata subsp. burmannicoides]
MKLLQVEGEEGEDGGPDDGSDGGGDREGRAGGARSRGLSGQGAGGRGRGDEDGAGNLSHLHRWRWAARKTSVGDRPLSCGRDEEEGLVACAGLRRNAEGMGGDL